MHFRAKQNLEIRFAFALFESVKVCLYFATLHKLYFQCGLSNAISAVMIIMIVGIVVCVSTCECLHSRVCVSILL